MKEEQKRRNGENFTRTDDKKSDVESQKYLPSSKNECNDERNDSKNSFVDVLHSPCPTKRCASLI